MENVFWEIFKKSGNIDAFMAYREFSKYKSNENLNIENNIKNII